MDIYDVLEYGPIVGKNSDGGYIVTVNGSYYNVWQEQGGEWVNVEAYDRQSRTEDLSGLWATVDAAKRVLGDLMGYEVYT